MGDALRCCSLMREPAASLSAGGWRLPDLLALTDVLDAAHARLVDIDVAFVAEKALLPGWIRTVGHAAGINLHALAGQATAVLAAWRSGAPDVMDVLFAPPPSSPPACDIARLGPGEVAVLVEALGARSDGSPRSHAICFCRHKALRSGSWSPDISPRCR